MLRIVVKVLLLSAVLAGFMTAIRLLLVEPDEMAAACAAHLSHWCWLRDLAIQGFVHKLYGYTSIAAALLAWLTGRSVFAVLAMVAGMAGVALYDFDIAALGLLLGVLLWVRIAAREPGRVEQQPRTE